MTRKVIGSLVALLLFVGAALADEVKGKFVKFDADKKVLTVKVKDGDAEKDQDFTLTKGTKVYKKDGEVTKQGLSYFKLSLKEGTALVLTTEKKDDAVVVTEVKWAAKKK